MGVLHCSREKGLRVVLKNTGRTLWEKSFEGGCDGSPAFDEKHIYVGANDGFFYALKRDNGNVVWKEDLSSRSTGAAVIAGGRVFQMTGNQRLWAFDASTGKRLWIYRRNFNDASVARGITIRGVARPLVVRSRILVGFGDGALVSLRVTDGGVIWERDLAGNGKFHDVDATPVVFQKQLGCQE